MHEFIIKYLHFTYEIVESLRSAYVNFVYGEDSEEAKKGYYHKHINPSLNDPNNGGAHFIFLENIVNRNIRNNDQLFFLSSSTPTIADIQIFDICDLVSFFFKYDLI